MRRLGRPRRRYAKLTRTCSGNPVHSVCDAEASSGEHIHNDEQGVAARQRITETGVGPLSEQPEPRGASDPQWANKTEELGRTRPAQSKKHPRLRSRSNTLRCPASRFRPTRFLDRVYPRHRSMDHLFPRMQTRLVAVTHCRLMCHLIEDRATRLPGVGVRMKIEDPCMRRIMTKHDCFLIRSLKGRHREVQPCMPTELCSLSCQLHLILVRSESSHVATVCV
jgi:hypothetical protein